MSERLKYLQEVRSLVEEQPIMVVISDGDGQFYDITDFVPIVETNALVEVLEDEIQKLKDSGGGDIK